MRSTCRASSGVLFACLRHCPNMQPKQLFHHTRPGETSCDVQGNRTRVVTHAGAGVAEPGSRGAGVRSQI